MRFFGDLKFFLKDRKSFFKKKGKEPENWFSLVLTLVEVLLLSIVLTFVFEAVIYGVFGIKFETGGISNRVITAMYWGAVMTAVAAGYSTACPLAIVAYILVAHTVVKIFGGKGSLFKTGQAVVYGIAFVLLGSWLLPFDVIFNLVGSIFLAVFTGVFNMFWFEMLGAVGVGRIVIALGAAIAGWWITIVCLKEFHKVEVWKAFVSTLVGLVALFIVLVLEVLIIMIAFSFMLAKIAFGF